MSSPVERLWKDKMDVYGWIEYIENGVTKSKEGIVNPNIKCHYSGGSLTDTGSDGIPTLINSHKLFCGIGTTKEGDKIIVTQRDGSIVNLIVGEGFPYSSGMQFSVKRDDTA